VVIPFEIVCARQAAYVPSALTDSVNDMPHSHLYTCVFRDGGSGEANEWIGSSSASLMSFADVPPQPGQAGLPIGLALSGWSEFEGMPPILPAYA